MASVAPLFPVWKIISAPEAPTPLVVRRIKSSADIAVTLSLGERPYEDYALWKAAGADRYLLRHETSNPELFKKLHPDSTIERRIGCLKELRRLRYQIGAGFMVGLPGQEVEDTADDVLLIRELEVDMAGVGKLLNEIPKAAHAKVALGKCGIELEQRAFKKAQLRGYFAIGENFKRAAD